jgi:hydroxyacylglutathione hydrolase
MKRVIVIPVLGDNFAYLFRYEKNPASPAGGKAVAVDPPEAGPILNEIKRHNLKLAAALATHHHWDHNAGIKELKNKTNCTVIEGSQGIKDGQIINFDNCRLKVITTPGHTTDSVCYYIEPSENSDGVLFTGDTLFIAGCGRPIENDMDTMWDSLQKLAALPEETLVYPGHDYTEDNCGFALTIEPKNRDVQKLFEEIRKKGGRSVVPSTIGREKQTNVFLRAGNPEVKNLINMPDASEAEVFAELRRRKNRYE